ncbi:MAG: type I restriction enzyme HsdR N-terminal domain-containing protein [Candidatus Omnitrophica bacterium]|nr:type I restriction enzyme HsdR N-terminal domain-containing protein [Candidatus Omnitrophota bacterium]
MEKLLKEKLERIVRLRENEVGFKEENVKFKVIIPLLELLGHKKENLDLEYGTKEGKEIDIFVKGLPKDCKVLIDAKNYTEDLRDHIEQIKGYTFSEAALITVIANGTEIRIYSPLRGVEFERSILYSIKRENLAEDSIWDGLSSLLGYEALQNKNAIKAIEVREKEIKDTIAEEERIDGEYTEKIEGIDADIEVKEEEIEQLKKDREALAGGMEKKKSEIWNSIGLPLELFKISQTGTYGHSTSAGATPDYVMKAKRVTFKELADAGLIKDGRTLYFYNTRLFKDEQAQLIVSSNKLKYKSDGKIYSTSELAKILLIKHGFKHDEHGVAGPKYWKTEDGKLLNDINEQLRRQRGDRK